MKKGGEGVGVGCLKGMKKELRIEGGVGVLLK